ncbi:MAG: hypothetical protein WCH82_06840 [Mycobacteriaceae bacterium]
MQQARRAPVALGAALATLAVAMTPALPASAAPLAWNGRYQMTTFASQKAGTSIAARQPEADFGAVFTLSTACSVTRCVATVVDGPAPSNPSIPQPTRFAWNGTDWTTTYDWLWDCLTTPGQPKQWARATSFTSYTPQPDGSLRGTWHTDISEGTCRGSVVMPVLATPA